MSNVEKMMVAAVKEQVLRVEGFKLKIEGRKTIEARLHKKRQSPDSMSVSEWVRGNFPGAETENISVLFADGHPAKRANLRAVRASYPADIRRIAKGKVKAEKKTADTTAQLKAKKKAIRQVKGDLKKSVQEINAARRLGENDAALDAVEKALRKPNSYHPRVMELCSIAISNGLHDTQSMIERILAAWSLAEKGKDIRR